MKLYEAIATIVQEFGKEIVTNAKVINVFNDYNAFEESKAFKVILKNLIAEGYMDQMMYVRDWSASQNRLISNFIAATSFNETNATYVIQSLAYGLGYTKSVPVYQQSSHAQQQNGNTGNTTNTNHSSQTTKPSVPGNASPYNGVSLDKTPSQIGNMSDSTFQKYKEAAEAYLESIVEFKSDFQADLGIEVVPYIEFDENAYISPKLEITGKIKIKYDYSIIFHVLLYDQNNRMKCKDEIYVGCNKTNFEVGETSIDPSVYHKVCNVKRIVVYWEKN